MTIGRTAFGALVRAIDPERAHRLAIAALRSGLVPPARPDAPILACTLLGRALANPLGLAAGFDKHAEVPDALLALGFGFVEVGTVTPLPQPGNPRPRVFRLPEDGAVINRYGFNSEGAEAAARRLAARPRRGMLGVNIGMNKETADPAGDFRLGAERLAPFADYLVVNVSSPNTPGLRALQGATELPRIVAAVRDGLAALSADARPPILVKIAPDLDEAALEAVAQAALAERLDGLIATNTTVARPAGLHGRHRDEAGGLSGRPLFARSTEVLATLYRLTKGRVPLIGVGGVTSGADALAKIEAGASAVQLYTALVFEGPGLIGRLKRELAAALAAKGYARVADAVGAAHRR